MDFNFTAESDKSFDYSVDENALKLIDDIASQLKTQEILSLKHREIICNKKIFEAFTWGSLIVNVRDGFRIALLKTETTTIEIREIDSQYLPEDSVILQGHPEKKPFYNYLFDSDNGLHRNNGTLLFSEKPTFTDIFPTSII